MVGIILWYVWYACADWSIALAYANVGNRSHPKQLNQLERICKSIINTC